MRVLAATTAGAGHFAGLLPFARACLRAGHEVRVAAPASFGSTVEGEGFVHARLGEPDPGLLGAVFGRIPAMTMQEADDLVVREVFGRLDSGAALPAVRDVVERWRPQVVLREPAEVASCIAAAERGIPQVQTSIGLSSLDDRFLPLLEGVVPEAAGAALRNAPRWTVVPPSFDVPSSTATGPVTRGRDLPPSRPADPLPPWWSGDPDRPLVYVSFGSVAAGMGMFPVFYARVLEQLADLPVRVLLTLGQAGDPEQLGTLPDHVHVERWWPQRDVLARAAVVVSHGGFGTTQAALAAGVPQVVVPLFSFDQFLNAERVAATGVGRALVDASPEGQRAGDVIPHGPAAADQLAATVRDVLAQPDHQQRARALAAEVDALPDVDACVAALPALCG